VPTLKTTVQIEFEIERFHFSLDENPGSYLITYECPLIGHCAFFAVMDDFGNLMSKRWIS